MQPTTDAEARRSTLRPELATLPEKIHPEQRLNRHQVMLLVGVKSTKLNELVKAGHLPRPERHGTRCLRWRAQDLLACLEERRQATQNGARSEAQHAGGTQ